MGLREESFDHGRQSQERLTIGQLAMEERSREDYRSLQISNPEAQDISFGEFIQAVKESLRDSNADIK